MTTAAGHGYSFLEERMSHILCFLSSIPKCKMKRIAKLSKSKVIMVENLKTKILRIFLILMEYPMISPALELHKKNGVVERKNRILHEMARTMIQETNMAKHFWA